VAQLYTVGVTADGEGAFSWSRHFVGQVLAVKVVQGTLGNFTLSVADHDFERSVLDGVSITGDAIFQTMSLVTEADGTPIATNGGHEPIAVIGTLDITVTGATASGKGYVRLLLA